MFDTLHVFVCRLSWFAAASSPAAAVSAAAVSAAGSVSPQKRRILGIWTRRTWRQRSKNRIQVSRSTCIFGLIVFEQVATSDMILRSQGSYIR